MSRGYLHNAKAISEKAMQLKKKAGDLEKDDIMSPLPKVMSCNLASICSVVLVD